MATQGSTIDPTKAAKYPIILSDALLGKASKETYTGVRYNHKPTLSSETAPNSARLKQSAKEGVFNLGFDDQGKVYQYSGTRTSEDGKYVLIFDPARKAFVLHRVDSIFHMNLTKTPTDGNVESLRKQFPHLEVTPNAGNSAAASTSTKQTKAKTTSAAGGKVAASKATPVRGKDAKAEVAASKAKAEKAKADKNKAAVALTLPSATAAPAKAATPPPAPAPVPVPEKKKSRARSPIDSEEDDSDDDIGLTIEYPDGPPRNHFSPAFPTQRRFSEFVRSNEDGDTDAEGDMEDDLAEVEEEFEDAFKLPSPVNRGHPSRPPVVEEPIPIEEPLQFTFHSDTDSDADGDADVDMAEADAHADADAAFDEDALLLEFQDEGNESDSSVSEEE